MKFLSKKRFFYLKAIFFKHNLQQALNLEGDAFMVILVINRPLPLPIGTLLVLGMILLSIYMCEFIKNSLTLKICKKYKWLI